MKLKITQFGNPVLRQVARRLTVNEIHSDEIKMLIKEMKALLVSKKLGVGLAAPQIGQGIAVAIIELQKTPLRPEVEPFSMTIINPKITKTFGTKNNSGRAVSVAGRTKQCFLQKYHEYHKIELEYYDQNAQMHRMIFEGLQAHVIQHEVDHLNGILFVDKVRDTKTYMTYSEYKKMKERKA